MIIINKQELKSRLLEDGYVEENGLNATISHLLNLSEEPTRMLYDWIKTKKTPEFSEIYGISSDLLRQSVGMKEPAIIIAFDMLLTNPKRNSILLHNIIRKRVVSIKGK